MKYCLSICLMFGLSVFGQTSEKESKPHLERKTELSIGSYKSLFEMVLERQLTDYFSVGVSTKVNPYNELQNVNGENLFSVSARGRYYFKYYTTHSFLYLFFDDKIKIRYFVEADIGYAYSTHKFTERYLDNNNNYVITRNQKRNNSAFISFGVGCKLLLNKKYTMDISFGRENHFMTNKNSINFGYGRLGFGYRF